MSKQEIDKFLAEPNIAVVAVTAPDGAPHAVPTWYLYERGEIVFQSGPDSFKCKCLRKNPLVTFCIDTKQAPYKAVILKGRVTMEEGRDDARTLKMAQHYLGDATGKQYADSVKGEPSLVLRFKPTRVVSWDYSRDM